MKRHSKFTGAGAGAALVAMALVPAGVAQAKPAKHVKKKAAVSGVVIHNNTAAHSFVVAERSGKLDAVHGRRQRVGTKVRVEVRKLANGTFAAKKLSVVERPRTRVTTIRGVVSAEDAVRHEIVVSAAGSSIRVGEDAATTTGDTSPAVGEAVDATVEVSGDGSITARDIHALGQTQAFRIEGKVLAIDTATRTLTITADDDGASGQSTTVALPDSFDLAAFSAGDCVELTVTKAADGSLVAVQSFGDDNSREADNGGHSGRGRGGPNGDQSDHSHEGGDHGGGSGGSHSGSSDATHTGSDSSGAATNSPGSPTSGSHDSGTPHSGSGQR